jgi:hypothetical protein
MMGGSEWNWLGVEFSGGIWKFVKFSDVDIELSHTHMGIQTTKQSGTECLGVGVTTLT